MAFFVSFRRPLHCGIRAFCAGSFAKHYVPAISVACSGKKSQGSVGLLSSLDHSWETVEKRIRNTSQDSFFVSKRGEIGGAKELAVGVFDGVGGWEASGIDVRSFSWGLSQKTRENFEKQAKDGGTVVDALKIGFQEVLGDKSIVGGGATACLSQFCGGNGIIRVINLGDSGYSIYRNGSLLFRSNIPFDLRRDQEEGGKYIKNEVDEADVYNHQLKHGDVVLLSTDGILDNLFFEGIERVVTKTLVEAGIWLKSGQNILPCEGNVSKDQLLVAAQVSRHLVVSAKKNAQNTKIDTPFALEARKHRFFYQGGKPDDITALVLIILDASLVTTLFPPSLFCV
ncbi:hypothetical protein MERGE_001673 [Pneumocystis wakefieldiae]|uniref:Protein phosphatase n=1 Tax=Pneumocystis wakefieldiae TaxID=38082 RepID=A0A899FWF5_9ASCO|nr:hypothetical protein MERGE_001673 [Pneumocystis wakefieldiae]